jgi:hypothetical protein
VLGLPRSGHYATYSVKDLKLDEAGEQNLDAATLWRAASVVSLWGHIAD